MIHREALEWTNTWWEQAESEDLPRVLLIGDSISVGYHTAVQKELDGLYYVDRFSTSKFISDPFFRRELELYASEYTYRCIHFNHGLHGLDFPLEVYRDHYRRPLEMLLARCPRVILALSTPITEVDHPDVLSAELNPVVLARNEAVLRLAEEYRLPVNDLYEAVAGKPSIRKADGYHYTEEGAALQGKQVAQAVRKAAE